MRVIAWNVERDGPLTEGALRAVMEAAGYVVTRRVHPPGTVFSPHRHGADRQDAVLSGRFCMEMAGKGVVPGPGDRRDVPAGRTHAARVAGGEPVVSLDGVRR